MKKMNHNQAVQYLYCLWENNEVPSNFTEEHSEWPTALNQLKTVGCIDWDSICVTP